MWHQSAAWQTTPGRDSSRANILREVDISLERLDTDHIDVYLIHWPDQTVPFEEAFGAMDECVKAGKVRFVGVSNFTVEQMEACMKVRPIDVIQVGYHLFDRRMEQEIFPFCAKNDIGVMGYGSLAHGLLTGAFSASTTFDAMDWRGGGIFFGQPLLKGDNLKTNVGVVDRLKSEVAEPRGVPLSQIALAWVLRNPVVSTALVGSRTPQELQNNLAGADLELTHGRGQQDRRDHEGRGRHAQRLYAAEAGDGGVGADLAGPARDVRRMRQRGGLSPVWSPGDKPPRYEDGQSKDCNGPGHADAHDRAAFHPAVRDGRPGRRVRPVRRAACGR